MVARNYWTDSFTIQTWEEFLNAGGKVSGHPERRRNAVQKIKPGDYLLAYLTGISRFVAILEVVSDPYCDKDTRIWQDALYPWRLKVKIVRSLTPETAVPIKSLEDQLTFFQNLTHPSAWTYPFKNSPYQLDAGDGEAIANAVMEAARNPLSPPIPAPERRNKPKPPPPPEHPTEPTAEREEGEKELVKEASAHDEIQWMLSKLGNDMGLDVWVARNDRNRVVGGHKFTDLEHLKEELPRQFDEAINRTIEHIDVLWLKGNAITAAFEIEHTTSIYSGLLRMSDLIAMQPHFNIPLYIVVPEERRKKVITEVNRPTFSRLSPPLSQICRLITFTKLRNEVQQLKPSIVANLRSNFIKELSEPCKN